MLIKKRNKNTEFYKLLNSDNKLIRHYKLIKTNYKNNAENIISQKINEYGDKIFIDDYYDISNYNNAIIEFNNLYESPTDIKNVIDENLIINTNEIFNTKFSEEQQNNINNILNNSIGYIRLGIDTDNEHEYFIKKLYETTVADYFNDFDEYNQSYQNKLINNIINHNGDNDKISPMYNDLIVYSNAKYAYLKNKETELLNNE